MAAPTVVISDPARRDLDEIWDYVAGDASPEIADFVVARLYEALHRAAERPLLYRKRSEYTGKPRRINVFSYAIFYDALPDASGVFIWRVIHGKRDIQRVIRRPRPRR
jgi:toxin ParE1/3/4